MEVQENFHEDTFLNKELFIICVISLMQSAISSFSNRPDQPSVLKPNVNTVPLIRLAVKLWIALTVS